MRTISQKINQKVFYASNDQQLFLLMKRRVSDHPDPNVFEYQDSPISYKVEVKTKPNSENLPLYIMPDHIIIVFTQTPLLKKIYNVLKSFSEPIYRPKFIHEYKITKFSLYTAMVLHYTGQQIISILKKLSKNESVPQTLENQIMDYMKHAGEVRFTLIEGQYYIFTTEQLSLLIADYLEKIEEVKVTDIYNLHLDEISEEIQDYQESQPQRGNRKMEQIQEDPYQQFYDDLNGDKEAVEARSNQRQLKAKQKTLIKYKVKGDYFQVTKRLISKNIPIVQEFDFMNCKELQDIQIQMNSDVQLRFYQEAALKNVFIGGKARSGLIILPCGAGKSMVAIELIQRIKKKAIIFCENQTSATQWKQELIRWTTIQRSKIVILTSKYKATHLHEIDNCSIFITTYSMVGLKRERENKFLERTKQIPWGVCIVDEVHKLPADTFQIVLQKYKFYLKIGLTATPYREDNKIDNLYYMVGPKLYEQNWLDLVNEGCLAKPYCVQILCHMTPMFKQSYQQLHKPQLLHTANPQKFRILQYLLKKHTQCGDKILVFCDRPKILQRYAKILKKPFIHGGVDQNQRVQFYNAFKTIKEFNVLFLSRVGDTAIDLPCANVGIQIGMHFKSRRQEVQRMGRIMRPKDNPNNQFNAFFYTLISLDTNQVQYSRQRHKVLIDQGFQHQIKMATAYNLSGIKMQEMDEKDHLVYVLSQHEDGDLLLNKGNLMDKRGQTRVSERKMDQIDYYYDEEEEY